VLVAHQNVIANGKEAQRGGSESMVGGVGGIDYTAFDGFDYVALGHIHAAYPVGRETVRYAGSPLCYHFEETRQQKKGPVLVELGPKGAAPVMQTQTIPPLHPMREVRGAYPDIEAAERNSAATGEYVRIVLTDRRVTPEISDHLHSLFENRGSILMELVSEYDRFSAAASVPEARAVGEKAVEELFADFYAQRKEGAEPDEADLAILRFAGEQVRRGDWADRNTPDQKAVDALLKFVLGQEAAK
jgi:exonuclease SbcD